MRRRLRCLLRRHLNRLPGWRSCLPRRHVTDPQASKGRIAPHSNATRASTAVLHDSEPTQTFDDAAAAETDRNPDAIVALRVLPVRIAWCVSSGDRSQDRREMPPAKGVSPQETHSGEPGGWTSFPTACRQASFRHLWLRRRNEGA